MSVFGFGYGIVRLIEGRNADWDQMRQTSEEQLRQGVSPADRAAQARMVTAIASALGSGILFFSAIHFLSNNLALSLVASFGAFLVPSWAIEVQQTRQMIKVSEQLDQAMGLLSAALRRNTPLEIAIAQAADACGNPLKGVLEQVVAATGVGLSFDQAILASREHPAVAENPDYQVFATQAAISHNRGANVLETFEALRNAIAARRRYRAAVQEAEGVNIFQSVLIFGIGFVVLFAYAAMTPEGLAPLMRHTAGQITLLVSILGNVIMLRTQHIAMLRRLRKV